MSKPLTAALRLVAERIEKHSGTRRLNESATKVSLIDPILEALGWDVRDVDEVQLEFRPRRRDNPVDYAMFDAGSPRMFVEAKALGSKLDDRKWASQVLSYATVAGVPWVVLTDGQEWRVFNAHAPVDVDGKLFRTVNIVAAPDRALEVLRLISKESLQTNEIEALWQAHFVDRKVRAALEGAFGAEADPAVVRLIGKLTTSLSQADIRASLRRMRLSVQFPHDGAEADKVRRAKAPSGSGKSPRASTEKKPRRTPVASSVTLQDLLRVGLLIPGAKLGCRYLGQDLEATVLEDGTVRVGSTVYDSPSAAGGAARAAAKGLRQGTKHPATNGWSFWFVEADGGRISLGGLRDRYTAEHAGRGATSRPRLRALGDE